MKYYGTTLNNELKTGILATKGDDTSILVDMNGNQYVVKTSTLKRVPVKG
jgi:hypothetical protein